MKNKHPISLNETNERIHTQMEKRIQSNYIYHQLFLPKFINLTPLLPTAIDLRHPSEEINSLGHLVVNLQQFFEEVLYHTKNALLNAQNESHVLLKRCYFVFCRDTVYSFKDIA